MVICAGTIGSPEIEVEDSRQLLGGGKGKQVPAVLEAAVCNHRVQDVGGEERHGARQAWVVGDAGEDIVASAVLRHGPAMIPTSGRNEQS
jgi:hypothetical protein